MSITLQGLDHVVLRVTNPDQAVAFYCNALGCHIERRQDDIGLIQLRAGNSLIDLVPVDSP
ncbi:MAG: VOC family protein, partial [Candidatus Competibacteraceae bacterium]|nr:VOC family protein [Candidatus Competibacteraceae bacterium]